ncbi:hypothetical protein CLF_109896 [Clonorchis sinensis]|uniref:Uncharacterized protein n=1 Tax=Clonorchis sinensis TaxID=79923 RepID=G7YT15_CLOSI|nr:hypothetical protein CLF_109896 [Clonorchis sinensis]
MNCDRTVSETVTAQISKTLAIIADLLYLWFQNRIPLGSGSRVYETTLRAVLLYWCERWPLLCRFLCSITKSIQSINLSPISRVS